MTTKIKYVITANAKELEAVQNKAIKSVVSARVAVQVAAVATISHAFKHGDWTYAQRLVDGLGNTVNGAALVEWFKVYGGLTTNDEGFSGWKGAKHIEAMFQKAKETMWWDLKKVSPFKGYSLEENLLALIKNHKAMLAKQANMSEEDKAKVSITVNNDTIQAVCALCNFEAILTSEDSNNAAIAALEEALAA
jgi:hypothetical protein